MPDLQPPAKPKKVHRSPEERMADGETIATFDDLEGLTLEELAEVAGDCSEDADPDTCVACRAFALYLEKHEQEDVHAGVQIGDIEADPEFILYEPVPEETSTDVPVVERFANQVKVLDALVEELLNGPPIPPRNVTLEELAVLTFAAQQWSASLDANRSMGLLINDQQEQVKTHVDGILRRLRRD